MVAVDSEVKDMPRSFKFFCWEVKFAWIEFSLWRSHLFKQHSINHWNRTKLRINGGKEGTEAECTVRCTSQSQLGPLEQYECAETVKPVCISGPEQRGEREANKAVERLRLSQIAPLCTQYGYEPDLSCTLTSTCPSKIHDSSPLTCVRGKMARSEAVTFTYHLSLFSLPLKSTNSTKFSGGGECNIASRSCTEIWPFKSNSTVVLNQSCYKNEKSALFSAMSIVFMMRDEICWADSVISKHCLGQCFLV